MRTETSLAVQRIQYMVNAWMMCVYSVQWQRWTCWWLFSRLSLFSLVWEPTPHPECLSSSLKPLGKLSQTHPEVCLLGDFNPKMLTMRIIHCKVYLRPSTGTHLKCLSAAEETGIAGRMIQKESCALVIHLYKPFIRHAWQRDTYKDHPRQCFTLPTSSNTNALQAEATASAPQLLYGQTTHWRSHS